MKNTSRRKFLKQSLGIGAAASLLPACVFYGDANSKQKNAQANTPESQQSAMTYFDHIGLQLYTAREAFAQDGEATLQKIAEIGYKEIEFHDAALVHEYIHILSDLDLRVTSTHFTPPYLTGEWQAYGLTKPPEYDFETMRMFCQVYSVGHLVMPMLLPQERGDAEHYKRLADTFNTYGALCKKEGVMFCYHNHNFEFGPLEGTTAFDILLQETDPDLVSFELDVFWVAVAGIDPVAFMKQHADRIKLLHLKDLQAGFPSNFKTLETSENHPEVFLEVGNGILDFDSILKTAAEIGVTNCYVEQDHSPDPLAGLATSYQYLSKLGL